MSDTLVAAFVASNDSRIAEVANDIWRVAIDVRNPSIKGPVMVKPLGWKQFHRYSPKNGQVILQCVSVEYSIWFFRV